MFFTGFVNKMHGFCTVEEMCFEYKNEIFKGFFIEQRTGNKKEARNRRCVDVRRQEKRCVQVRVFRALCVSTFSSTPVRLVSPSLDTSV